MKAALGCASQEGKEGSSPPPRQAWAAPSESEGGGRNVSKGFGAVPLFYAAFSRLTLLLSLPYALRAFLHRGSGRMSVVLEEAEASVCPPKWQA